MGLLIARDGGKRLRVRGLGHMPSVCGIGSNASGSNPSVQAARPCQACAGLVHVRENSVLSFKWMIMCVYCSTQEGVYKVCVHVHARWIH